MAVPSTLSSALDSLGEEHLRRLLHLSQEFNSTIDLDTLLPQVLDLVLETLNAEAGSLWLLERETLRCHLARGPTAEQIRGLELPLGAGIVGDAVARRTSLLVTEVPEDPRFLHQVDEMTGFQTRSIIAVPLVARGQTLGAIQVLNERTGEDGIFTEEDRLFLEALADDAAAAIRNAQLFQAEKQARDLAALLEVSHQITSTLDLERVLLSIVNLAGRAVHFDRCILALWQEEELRVRAISGEEKVDRKAVAVRELERFLSWAAERGEEIFVPDLADPDDEAAAQVQASFPSYLEESAVRGFFLIPVADSEGRLGVLHFEFAAPNRLNEWSRKAATLLANEAALALRNAQLYASVPFISWLEPLAERRKTLAALPGSTWLRYGAAALAVLLVLTLVRIPLRLSAAEATVRAAVQQPARSGAGGIIEAVWVREGEQVAAGAPLAQVRDEELLRRYREAQAGLELANSEARAASARGDAMTAALARVRAAELSDALQLFTRQVEQTRVVAPASGVVLTPRLHELVGSYVQNGTPVLWIGDPQWVELELRVRQEDLGDVRVGNRVRTKVSAHPSVIFQGRVTAIAPRAEPSEVGSPTYAVRAMLDNRQQLLRPGMSARAKVVTDTRPLASFLFRRPWRWLRMLVWW
ncbi:MAG: GAF domain-containing protein [Gemmatimonadetes bacterium]|nr:GAF domain-containing protein [Gemmatimonadota bacterium]